MFTEIQARVGIYDGLPCLSKRRLFSGISQSVLDITEALAQRLEKQVVLALEMLVKTSVGQADSVNRALKWSRATL